MAEFTFKTKSGKTGVIEIGGATITSECHLAPNPIQTEVDSNNDFFAPIRMQSGKIRLIGGVGVLEQIIGTKPTDRPVTLKINGNIVWFGYLQSTSYSQDWLPGLNNIELPIVSPLTLLESINMDATDRGWVTFQDFLAEINEALDSPYTYITTPIRNDDYLSYSFNRKNYIEYDDDKKEYVGKSYKYILEDICKFFGWSCQEYGKTLYFLALDVDTMGNENLTIQGNDHKIDYLPGKKKVEVSASFQNTFTDYVKINTEELEVESSDYTDRQIGSNLIYCACHTFASSGQFVLNGNVNAKYLDFKNGVTTNRGSCLCEERFQKTEGYYKPVGGDSDYQSRISWRLANGSRVCHVTCKDDIEETNSNEMLVLQLTAKQATNADDTFENCPDGMSPFKIELRIGSYYYYFAGRKWMNEQIRQSVRLEGGELVCPAPESVAYGGYAIPFKNGDLEINIYSADEEKYYCLETLTLKRVINWKAGDEVKDLPIREYFNIQNGFKDEYSVQSTLACRKQQNQISYSFIKEDESSYIKFAKYVCDNTLRPEVDFANRIKSYYQQTRRKITARVSYVGKSIDPYKTYSTSTMNNYACLSQSVNWQDEEIIGQFFELP